MVAALLAKSVCGGSPGTAAVAGVAGLNWGG